jgi:GH35 family endo-1,4-beta-xylanase
MTSEESPGCPAEKTKEKEEQQQVVYIVACRTKHPTDTGAIGFVIHRAFVLEKDARKCVNNLKTCTQIVPEDNLKWELYEFELN